MRCPHAGGRGRREAGAEPPGTRTSVAWSFLRNCGWSDIDAYLHLESAEGRALDQVVALVGLARQRGGHAEGLLRFSRATPAPAA